MKLSKVRRNDCVVELMRQFREESPQPVPEWSARELRTRVRRVVNGAEGAMRDVACAYALVGRLLLEHVYDGDTQRALNPRFEVAPSLVKARREICERLGLEPHLASRCLRIAAITQVLGPRDPWSSLHWTLQRELLPLLSRDPTGALFRAGVLFASREGVTVSDLQAWREQNAVTSAPRRLAPLTVSSGTRAAAIGVKLDNTRSWNAFRRKLQEGLSEEELHAFAHDMLQAGQVFERRARELLEELGEDAG